MLVKSVGQYYPAVAATGMGIFDTHRANSRIFFSLAVGDIFYWKINLSKICNWPPTCLITLIYQPTELEIPNGDQVP